MSTQKWKQEKVVDGRRIRARRTRSTIIVRVEPEDDSSRYAEWEMPKILGYETAMAQANLQTKDEDMKA